MHDLASYLKARMPEGMNYSDAAQLCLRLYCTVDGVLKGLLPLGKETLSDAFSQLSSAGWVRGGDVDEIPDPRHWLAAIGAVIKSRADVVDMRRGRALARQLGFVTETGVS
jgi:hypothetical protein